MMVYLIVLVTYLSSEHREQTEIGRVHRYSIKVTKRTPGTNMLASTTVLSAYLNMDSTWTLDVRKRGPSLVRWAEPRLYGRA